MMETKSLRHWPSFMFWDSAAVLAARGNTLCQSFLVHGRRREELVVELSRVSTAETWGTWRCKEYIR
jgi:hypothetical protein